MAAGTSLLNLHPCLSSSLAAVLRSHPPLSLHHYWPHFSFSLLYLSPFPPLRSNRFSHPNRSPSTNSRHHSSATLPLPSLAPATTSNADGNGSSGQFGALSSLLLAFDSMQKIDMNSSKGTRDFPPEEMRLCNCLFINFREVSKLFRFEEVDFPVLESEELFIRKAAEEIRD